MPLIVIYFRFSVRLLYHFNGGIGGFYVYLSSNDYCYLITWKGRGMLGYLISFRCAWRYPNTRLGMLGMTLNVPKYRFENIGKDYQCNLIPIWERRL